MQIQTCRFECRFELKIVSLHILILYYCAFEFIRINLDTEYYVFYCVFYVDDVF